MKMLKVLGVIFALSFAFASCGSSESSSATGWNYNDPKWGGFEVSPLSEQETGPGLVFIEGGTFVMGQVADNIHHRWENVPRRVTVSSFYMDEAEVSNVNYREFIYYLSRVYGEEYPEYVKKYYPDTNVWRSPLTSTEFLVNYYFQTTPYNEYPVVGVSWEQAIAYCKWRTDRVNEKRAIDQGYLALNQADISIESAFQTDVYLAGQYMGEAKKELKSLDPRNEGEPRLIKMDDGVFLPNYRLPTEAEWEYAALGSIGNTVDERMVDRKIYPWKGRALRSDDKKYYGLFLANFMRGDGDYMGIAGNLNDQAAPTTVVRSYFPNDYGLYQMAGNVSEWCFDVYRKASYRDVSGFNPTRGNVYMEPTVVDEEILLNDTTGGIVYRQVDDDLNRRNYKQANNINYLDGDYSSLLSPDGSWTTASQGGSDEEGDESYGDEDEAFGRSFLPDSITKQMYDYGKTSLITNQTRVVKGGSWKDRAYWLASGTRRYYDQNRSADWIGFRCAMDRLGSQVHPDYR